MEPNTEIGWIAAQYNRVLDLTKIESGKMELSFETFKVGHMIDDLADTMRADRIIVGEVRAGEAFDMLQAMNTDHAGSMSTIHANSPRDSITRLEDMVTMTGFDLPSDNVRKQIASALDLIVQVERFRDGSRKVTHISEVIGIEESVITLRDIFTFEQEEDDPKGMIQGQIRSTGLRPHLAGKAAKFGRDAGLIEAVRLSESPE